MASAAEDIEKKLRAVRKKLTQIDKLKEKDASQLDDAAREKIATEGSLKEEVRELEAQVKSAGGGSSEVPVKPAQQAAPKQEAAAPKAKAKAKAEPAPEVKAKAKAEPAPAPAPPAAAAEEGASSGLSPAEQEKRIKNIKKKLQQIEKLREREAKGDDLDWEAKDKIASEVELRKEMACVERGEEYTPPPVEVVVKAKAKAAPAAPAGPAGDGPEEPAGPLDLHTQARADALAPPPGDIGLLIDDETEKRFKNLQKKLRDIAKLWEQSKRDRLQEQKLMQEPGLIDEINVIRDKAEKLLLDRRAKFSAATAAKKAEPAFKPAPRPNLPAWQCNECGASGDMGDLIGGEGAMACFKCGGSALTHNIAKAAEEDDDGEDDGGDADQMASKKEKVECKDLKTARQKKAAPATKKEDSGPPTPASATWPELKEVLESGDRGVDQGRQKKAIEVSHAKDGAPYSEFDSVLLKCSFLTRIELKLPLGVLDSEAFQLYFPGALSDSLLELILKQNQMTMVPPGLQQLQRIRSIDLSHNAISVLPDADTWESISTSLELLDLSFNKLTAISPLAPLKKLSQLKLDANQLTSLEGISWNALAQLSSFSAAGNQITEIPEGVGDHAVALEWMEMSENKMTTIPTNIGELKKLKILNITGNPIKDQKIVKAAEKGCKDLKTYLSKIGGEKGKRR